MKTMYIGTYSGTQASGVAGQSKHIQIYLHCLDPNTYLLGDDADGLCFADLPIPAKIGDKVMGGDFEALAEAGAEIASIVNRPQFIFAEHCMVTETDSSLLHAEQYQRQRLSKTSGR